MKTIALIIAVILAGSGIAQTKGEKIWQYANDHLGQKIGNGSCDELVIYAYKNVCGCNVRKRTSITNYEYSFGVEVPKDSATQGDVVVFSCYEKKTGKEISGHVGIVYAVSENNMSIINQNYKASSQKESVVTVAVWKDIIEIDSTSYTQKIAFYRPQ